MSGPDEREEKDGGQRGRPGRRSLQDLQNSVPTDFLGKATIAQTARRLGCRPETLAGGPDAAQAGMASALMRGDGPREQERERRAQHRRAAGLSLAQRMPA